MKPYSSNPKAVAQRELRDRRRKGIPQHANRANSYWKRVTPWATIAHLFFEHRVATINTRWFQAHQMLDFAVANGHIVYHVSPDTVTHESPNGTVRKVRDRVLHATHSTLVFWEKTQRIKRVPNTSGYAIPSAYLESQELEYAEA